jgi:hypothetical protein
MVAVKKKRILIFSDGSILASKTMIKTSNKIKTLTKDHKTFLLNKKDGGVEHDSKDLKGFKARYLKF